MRRWAVCVAVLGVLVGCTSKTPPPEPADQPPVQAESVPEVTLPPKPAEPREGQWLSREDIPNALAGAGPTLAIPSPDGKWRAVRTMGIGDNKLWVLAEDGSGALLAESNLSGYAEQMLLWSPAGTLLHYRWRDNLWIETDPATRAQKPFLPELLAGRSAGNLRFSPDGKRFLYNIGVPYQFNKPPASTQTTYAASVNGSAAEQVGVDVDAAWSGDQLAVTRRAPGRGYDMFFYMRQPPMAGDVYLVERPFGFGIEIVNQQRAQWRVYSRDGKQLLRVIPAVESDENSSHGDHRNWWRLTWVDPPAEPVLLQLWLEVRPGVPDPPEVVRENGSRWVVAFDIPVMSEEQKPARPTVLLDSIRMHDTQTGWGTDVYHHLLRTADGGTAWRDVTPPALRAIEGRLQIRRAEFFAGSQAAVAYKYGVIGADGTWTRDIYRVRVTHTANGGRTWTDAAIDTGYEFVKPVSVGFTDARSGWLLVRPEYPVDSNEGTLYRTADGGRTWQRVADTALPSNRGVTFTDPDNGWVLSKEGLWQTTDGGTTWQLAFETPPEQTLAGLPQFVTEQVGYLSVRALKTGQVAIYATGDGGRTWEKRHSLAGYGTPVFLNADMGWTWEYESGTLYLTHDGGRTWTARKYDHNKVGVESVQFVAPEKGFVANRQLYTTADGGRTWTPVLARYVE